MRWLRNLYDWVLKWSNSKYGPLMLGLMAFAEASFFPTFSLEEPLNDTVFIIIYLFIDLQIQSDH